MLAREVGAHTQEHSPTAGRALVPGVGVGWPSPERQVGVQGHGDAVDSTSVTRR
jgi:hypothetical protein